MPIASSDIKIRLSGGASNSDPNAALGGAKSSTDLVDATLHNLFDVVTGAEHTAGDTEYRCVYVHNAHGSLTLTSAVLWISSDSTSSESELDVGVGSSAINGTEQTIANESTAPTSVTFSHPTTRATGIALGDIPAGQHRAVWMRRTITAGSTPQAADAVSFQAGGDTL